MNKICFALSCIVFVIGVITLLMTAIINRVMPTIGRAAYQAAAAGSYNPNDYHINFLGVNFAAICLIIIGVVFGYRLYKSERR